MALSTPFTASAGAARGVTAARLFLTAFACGLLGSLIGSGGAMALAGPSAWLAGSLAGGGLAIAVSRCMHAGWHR